MTVARLSKSYGRIIKRYEAARKGVVKRSWTELVDEALRMMDGLTEREAEERYRISDSTIHRWRELRANREEISTVRGAPKQGLLRMLKPNEAEGWAASRADEETPEQAVAENPISAALAVIDRVIRLSGGAEDLTPERRKGLMEVFLNDEIDDWEERGWDTRPLLERLRRVTRGEFD